MSCCVTFFLEEKNKRTDNGPSDRCLHNIKDVLCTVQGRQIRQLDVPQQLLLDMYINMYVKSVSQLSSCCTSAQGTYGQPKVVGICDCDALVAADIG